jgi:hypothetical protein
MGFRVLLIAVSGKEPETVHREYGVVPTDEFWDSPEPPVAGARLPSGSYLLYVHDEIVPDDAVFARLSSNARLLACYVNETSMESLATAWVNGRNEWQVRHDASNYGNEHLEASGDLPPQYLDIRDRLLKAWRERHDSDYVFDVPVQLVKELGGFQYDEDIDVVDSDQFQVLQRTNLSGKKGTRLKS